MRKLLVLGCLLSLAGCTLKTETGYRPTPLGDNTTVQRGYYASPFSREAHDAARERSGDGIDRRPNEWR